MPDFINIAKPGKPAVTAEMYAPGDPKQGSVVIIAYGSEGLTDHLSGPWGTMIRGYAESLAEAGFVVLIPDYLGVTRTNPGFDVFASIVESRDEWQAAVSDAIDHAVTLSGRSTVRVGLLGFSLGGYLCLCLRAKADVLVEYFAPILDGIGTSGSLTHAQIHHGESDVSPGTEFLSAVAIREVLKREGTLTELFPYPGAGHGFVDDDKANADARTLSKDRTLSFFRSHL